jgi:undecaprenyl-diphosphatase
MLVIMGLVLWGVDRATGQERDLAVMRWTDAAVIGLVQALALIPGVSRSGCTITAARGLRFSRESAAVFSFLMSLPIVLGAVVHEAPRALHESGSSISLAIGVLASAVSGWLAIGVLLKYVARHSYGLFALYRVLAGGAILILVWLRA